jgi:hypothetical protein
MVETLPGNREDREVYLREHRAGSFVEAVKSARRDALDTVILSVGAFAGEPKLLYVALEYAYGSGVTITMAPDPAADPSRSSRGRPA